MSIKRTYEIKLTPGEIAQQLAKMDSHEQAHFFNVLGASPWWQSQLAWIVISQKLTSEGLEFMKLIGEYAAKGMQ